MNYSEPGQLIDTLTPTDLIPEKTNGVTRHLHCRVTPFVFSGMRSARFR